MTKNDVNIEILGRFTYHKIHELAHDNEWLKGIEEKLAQVIKTDAPLTVLSDDEIRKVTKYSDTAVIGTVFSPHDVQILREIARDFLDLAVDDLGKNEVLVEVAKILHPLYSQDWRTEQIGWDLEEYIDYYFAEPTKVERMKYAGVLLDDWRDIGKTQP